MNVGKCIIQPLYFRERNEREHTNKELKLHWKEKF